MRTAPTLRWEKVAPLGESIFTNRISAEHTRSWCLHDHDFYECFLVERGEGSHLLAGGPELLEANQFHFIRPEQCHGFEASAASGLAFTNVAIEARSFESFIQTGVFNFAGWSRGQKIDVLSSDQCVRFLDLVREISHGARDRVDAHYFLSGLARLTRPSDTEPAISGLPDWLREALQPAAHADNLQSGVRGLVRLCGRSPEHVARAFQKYLGQTPTAWMNRVRIQHAQRLLETSRSSILEVALESGFENMSHFHRVFRLESGQTPRRHRERAMGVQWGR